MDIREFLELQSSRINMDFLADKLEEEPELVDLVWDIMLEDDDPVSMRASWALMIFARRHPYFFESRVADIVEVLRNINSKSILRCLLGILTMVPIPEEQSGYLFDFCFDIIESSSPEIAPKAYSMTILYNISEMEPDLKPELITLFESKLDHEHGGMIARSRILLKKLYKDTGLPRNSIL